MNGLKAVCGVVLTLAGAYALIAIGAFFVDARLQLETLTLDTARIETKLGDTAERLGPVLADVHAIQVDTTRTEAEMAGLLNQTRHSLLTPAQTQALVDRATNLLDNANLSVTRLGTAASSLETLAPSITEAVSSVSAYSHELLEESTEAARAAANDLNDPAIHQTLAHVDGMAGNLDATSADISAFVHRETTPVRGTWNVVKAFLREFAGPAAQVTTAIK